MAATSKPATNKYDEPCIAGALMGEDWRELGIFNGRTDGGIGGNVDIGNGANSSIGGEYGGLGRDGPGMMSNSTRGGAITASAPSTSVALALNQPTMCCTLSVPTRSTTLTCQALRRDELKRRDPSEGAATPPRTSDSSVALSVTLSKLIVIRRLSVSVAFAMMSASRITSTRSSKSSSRVITWSQLWPGPTGSKDGPNEGGDG